MLRHTQHTKIFLIVSSLVMVLIVLIGVMAQTSYTYSSRAYEEPVPRVISSASYESQTLPPEQTPDCVARLSYLPSLSDSQTACFVQFECAKDRSPQSDLLTGYSCTAEEQNITCDRASGCLTVAEWTAYASKVCGC